MVGQKKRPKKAYIHQLLPFFLDTPPISDKACTNDFESAGTPETTNFGTDLQMAWLPRGLAACHSQFNFLEDSHHCDLGQGWEPRMQLGMWLIAGRRMALVPELDRLISHVSPPSF
jgi:hypothetical protein